MPSRCCVSHTGSGVCPDHKNPKTYVTLFNIGANTVRSNSLANMNVGGVGISTCGHPTIALLGSSSVIIEGRGSHRVGDTGSNSGVYVAMFGAPNVNDGG